RICSAIRRDWPTARSPSTLRSGTLIPRQGSTSQAFATTTRASSRQRRRASGPPKRRPRLRPGRGGETTKPAVSPAARAEAAAGTCLADFLDERVSKPLKMRDTAFWVPPVKTSRLAQPLAVDLASGQPIKVIDVSKEPKNDSGGAGAISTAADYLRFSQMLLNGGQLDGTRILSRTTVALMTSDHLGSRIATPFGPGELLLGTPGYTFGLGFAVRPGGGIAGVPGSAGEFMWAGYAGTY